jgi:hypothetical protein
LEPLSVVLSALLGIAKDLNRLVEGAHIFSRDRVGGDVGMVLPCESSIGGDYLLWLGVNRNPK